MNTTEERLVDALKTVGDTLGPQDVPPLRLPPKRRSVLTGPLALAAVAASVIAIVAGVVAITSGGSAPAQKTEPLTRPTAEHTQITIFLCTRTSSNPACGKEGATQAQKDAIKNELEKMPEVLRVTYESRQSTYERFMARFAPIKEGDIPDSFRVTVRAPRDMARVMRVMLDCPGVDLQVKP